MRIHVMLMLLIITGNLISYVSSSLVKNRTWHEEFVSFREGQHGKILYPRYKVCRAPREKAEKIKPRSSQSNVKTAEVSWAELLSIYSSDSGSEIYSWDFWKKDIDKKKSTRKEQFISLLSFLALVNIIFIIFVFLVPAVGKCGFKFYSLIWLVLFHPEVRRVCRRMYITKEKISRKHMQLLAPKADARAQQKRRPFRLPFILREYNEEEIPVELQYSGEEDTDGEVSSDGFETLLTRNKSRSGLHFAKNLVQEMAITEQQLAGSESEANVTAEPSKNLLSRFDSKSTSKR